MSKTAIAPRKGQTNAYSQPMELKFLLEPVMQAAMLAKQNVLLISKPGYGKSEILSAMGNQVFGEGRIDDQDHTFVLTCTPSTLPPDVVGFANPVYSMDAQAKEKGLTYWITEGTPVNQNVMFCVLEEATRIGDLGGDTLIHAMHNISKYHRPLYVANANWLTPTPRNEALRDRFSFTIFYQPSIVDVKALIRTPAIESWEFDLPTFEEILEVQGWTNDFVRNPDNYRCSEVLETLLENIQRVCEGTEFEFNNRRVFQLRSMLYSMGAYYAKSPDFDKLPREAFSALAYAYPVVDFGQASLWKKIVVSLVDRVETEIAEFKANAYDSWQAIFNKHADRSGNIQAAQRDALTREMTKTWTTAERQLRENFPNDQRVEMALKEMFSIYREIILGRNPLRQ